jgi:acetylornithine deacetylase
VPRFLEAGLKAPIHLALSYDEEVGCIGVRQMIAELEHAEAKPIACIVGEPSSMKPILGHKGAKTMRCEVRGFEVHSSLAPRGVNAVEAAAELIAHIKSMARRTAKQGPFVDGFDPPHTTVHTGPIQGGTAHNIVPKDCVFTFEFRVVPGDDPDAFMAEVEEVARSRIEPEMQAVEASTGISFFHRSSYPGLATSEDAEITSLVKALTGANHAGKVSYGTEAGLFAAAGIPSIICGPGSIEQAHKPNEFVTRDQIEECERFLLRLAERLAA